MMCLIDLHTLNKNRIVHLLFDVGFQESNINVGEYYFRISNPYVELWQFDESYLRIYISLGAQIICQSWNIIEHLSFNDNGKIKGLSPCK